MKRRIVLVIILILVGLFLAFSVAAHPYAGSPYDAPLTFIEHKTDDGRAIFTNIPKKCFSKGRLACASLHPVFKGPGTIERPGKRTTAVTSEKTDAQPGRISSE